MAKNYEIVITKILQDLDTQHATYQNLYTRYYECEDEKAKHIHCILVKLCNKIYKEISILERK